MSGVTTRDLRTVLEISREAHEAQTVHELRAGLLVSLRQLVDCDTLGYNEIDLRRGSAFGIVDPAEAAPDEMERRFLSVAHQHPLVRCQQTGDLGVRTLSEFLTTRQFHRLELYHDFYKLISAEDQIAFGLGGEQLVAFALCRPTRGFTRRERELLELVRPHLALAYHRTREREHIRDLIEMLESGLQRLSTGVIQIDERARLVYATDTAVDLLHAYFGPLRLGETLPAPVQDQLTASAGSATGVKGPRGRLNLYEPSDRSGEWRTLILEEQRMAPPSLDSLRALGLTPRQAQIVRLLACGKQTKQIAAELQISVATLAKHFEHIYERLEVHSRAQVLARIGI